MSLSDSSSERSFNSEDSEANLAEVEDEQSDRESQVTTACKSVVLCACESLENDIAYADEPLAEYIVFSTRWKESRLNGV